MMIPDAAGTVRFCSTLDAALALATADADDVIYLMPGHTETCNSSSVVNIDVRGVTVIGLGQGSLQPTFLATTTSFGHPIISAADVTLKNVFVAAYSSAIAATYGIQLRSSGAAARNITIDGCRFGRLPGNSSGSFNSIIKITTDGGSTTAGYFDGLTIKNCLFDYYSSATTGGESIGIYPVSEAISNVRIINNNGTVVCSGLGFIYASGGASSSLNWVIADNKIANLSSTVMGGVALVTTSYYGVMANNFWGMGSTGDIAAGACQDQGNLFCIENYVATDSAADNSGVICPPHLST
jgi:hypothetical protein